MQVRASGLEWTILHPGLIFGEGDAFFAGALGDLVRLPLPFISPHRLGRLPFSFRLGRRRRRSLAQSLERRTTIGKVYDPAGSKEYTYRELVRFTHDALKSRKFPVSFPAGFFRLVSRDPFAPITRDQLLILLRGNTDAPRSCRHGF